MGVGYIAGIATPYKKDGPETESCSEEIFRTRPGWNSTPHSLLYIGHRVSLPGVKETRSGLYHPHYLALRLNKVYIYTSTNILGFMACSKMKLTCTFY